MKSATAKQLDGLKIHEIFYSLQGESTYVGLPTVFVRLTGCPLRCTYCDTAYAFHGGQRMTLAAIMTEVAKHPTRHVCITGGEPLAQPEVLTLITQLCDQHYHVSIETSGALSIADVDPRASRVVDFKTPSSGEVAKNLYDNLKHLTPHDQVKWVVGNEADYQWAKAMLQDHPKLQHVACLMSPVYDTLSPTTLAEWILRDGLAVRMQVQLHKILWGETPGK